MQVSVSTSAENIAELTWISSLIITLFWLQLYHWNVGLLCHRNALLRFY